MLFVKISFFVMYLNIFGLWRWMKVCSWVGGVLTVGFYGAMIIYIVAYDTPKPHRSFAQHIGAHGFKMAHKVSVPQACINLVLDLYIMVLPLIAVTRLHMSKQNKLSIIFVCMTALL